MMDQTAYTIKVKTGDRMFSGTDANVYIKLCCNNADATDDKLLDCLFRNDLETGQIDVFKFKRQKNLQSIDYIEIWRDDSGILDNWYLDYIRVTNTSSAVVYEFPVFRWIKADRIYRICHLDTSLPQNEPFKDQRFTELEEKCRKYELSAHVHDGPVQVQVPLNSSA